MIRYRGFLLLLVTFLFFFNLNSSSVKQQERKKLSGSSSCGCSDHLGSTHKSKHADHHERGRERDRQSEASSHKSKKLEKSSSSHSPSRSSSSRSSSRSSSSRSSSRSGSSRSSSRSRRSDSSYSTNTSAKEYKNGYSRPKNRYDKYLTPLMREYGIRYHNKLFSNIAPGVIRDARSIRDSISAESVPSSDSLDEHEIDNAQRFMMIIDNEVACLKDYGAVGASYILKLFRGYCNGGLGLNFILKPSDGKHGLPDHVKKVSPAHMYNLIELRPDDNNKYAIADFGGGSSPSSVFYDTEAKHFMDEDHNYLELSIRPSDGFVSVEIGGSSPSASSPKVYFEPNGYGRSFIERKYQYFHYLLHRKDYFPGHVYIRKGKDRTFERNYELALCDRAKRHNRTPPHQKWNGGYKKRVN